MRHRLTLALVLILLSAAPVWAQQTLCYVRDDGNDASCNGSADADASSAPNCAFATVGKGEMVCATPGSNIKIRGAASGSWYRQRVIFDQSGTAAQPIVIEGYGPTVPHIGGLNKIFANDPNWTQDPGADTWSIDYNLGMVVAAYILTSHPYEHDRVGLVNYLDYGDLNATDPNGFRVPNGNYYIGPGVHYNSGTSRLHIRLKRTLQVQSYEQNYLSLGLGADSDPRNYQILIAYGSTSSTNDYSLRTAANYLTFKKLTIEPALRSVQIACPATGPAKFVTFDENTIWSGNDGALHATCASEDITIKNNKIRFDVPYWISWGDCKNATDGPCNNWRFTMIKPGGGGSGSAGKRWLIDHNFISGGHDGYGTSGFEVGADPNDKITISYNVFEGFADDAFEMEETGVRRHDIYGNLIANSLNCFAVGQQTDEPGPIYGPFYFHSNTCVLLREPYVNRCSAAGGLGCTCTDPDCQAGDWNAGREYGHEYAFKIHDPNGPATAGLHVYNNTFVLTDSEPNKGMGVLDMDSTNAMVGAEIFNNVFIKMNQRVGQGGNSTWAYHTDPNTVNWNLYWKIHNDSGPLLDDHISVAGLCAEMGLECQGWGHSDYVGTNPSLMDLEGFGCFAKEGESCDGVDESGGTLWKIKTGSEYWSPSMFVPAGTSVVCNSGRNALPPGFPSNPAIPGIPFDDDDIGAIPCGVSTANWNVFPFTELWKSNQIAGGAAPNGNITLPTGGTSYVVVGQSKYFSGNKTDADGAPPFTYVWEKTAGGASCPNIPSVMTPGNVVFSNVATCSYSFKVTDRWGLQDPAPESRTIIVTTGGGGGGGCSDCSRCICNE